MAGWRDSKERRLDAERWIVRMSAWRKQLSVEEN